MYEVLKLFDARHGVKNDARLGIELSWNLIMDSMSGNFFDVMSGVKKLSNFIPAMNCPTWANEPSITKLVLHYKLSRSIHWSFASTFLYSWKNNAECMEVVIYEGISSEIKILSINDTIQ